MVGTTFAMLQSTHNSCKGTFTNILWSKFYGCHVGNTFWLPGTEYQRNLHSWFPGIILICNNWCYSERISYWFWRPPFWGLLWGDTSISPGSYGQWGLSPWDCNQLRKFLNSYHPQGTRGNRARSSVFPWSGLLANHRNCGLTSSF